MILFDLSCFSTESRFRGIGRYSRRIIELISKNYQVSGFLINNGNYESLENTIGYVNQFILNENIHVYTPEENFKMHFLGRKDKYSQIDFFSFVIALSPNIVVNLSPLAEPFQNSFSYRKIPNIPTLSVIYDFIPLENPRFYLADPNNYTNYFRSLEYLESYDHFWTISNFTEIESLKILNISKNQVSNIRGGGYCTFEVEENSNRSRTTILLVNPLDPRKNIDFIFKSVACMGTEKSDLYIQIVGCDNDKKRDFLIELAVNSGLRKEQVEIFGRLDDNLLWEKFQNAGVFVFPSESEGLGLPVLEAMHNGCPVLVADNSSLKELVPDRRFRFQLNDPNELAEKITSILTEFTLKHDNLDMSKVVLSKYNWSETEKIIKADLSRYLNSDQTNQIATKLNAFEDTCVDVSGNFSLERSVKYLRGIRETHALFFGEDAAVPKHIYQNFARLSSQELYFFDITTELTKVHLDGIKRSISEIIRSFAERNFGKIRLIRRVGDYYFLTDPALFFEDDSIDFFEKYDFDQRVSFLPGNVIFFLGIDWEIHFAARELWAAKCSGAIIISLVHDLLPLQHPEWFQPGVHNLFDTWFRFIVDISNKLLATTYTTGEIIREKSSQIKNSLVPTTEVIGLGVSHLIRNRTLMNRKSQVGAKQNLLILGTLEPRKGVMELLNIFDAEPEIFEEYNLRIVGKMGWLDTSSQKRFYEIVEANPDISWFSALDDLQLVEVLQETDTLLFPSLAEGFGLPILEAAFSGLKILARKIPTTEEIKMNVPGIPLEWSEFNDAKLVIQEIKQIKQIESTTKLQKTILDVYNYSKVSDEIIRVLRSFD